MMTLETMWSLLLSRSELFSAQSQHFFMANINRLLQLAFEHLPIGIRPTILDAHKGRSRCVSNLSPCERTIPLNCEEENSYTPHQSVEVHPERPSMSNLSIHNSLNYSVANIVTNTSLLSDASSVVPSPMEAIHSIADDSDAPELGGMRYGTDSSCRVRRDSILPLEATFSDEDDPFSPQCGSWSVLFFSFHGTN
jgi:hypothetical protein